MGGWTHGYTNISTDNAWTDRQVCIYKDLNVQDSWDQLSHKLADAMRNHIPTKEMRLDRKQRPLWMNKTVSSKVTIKQKAWRTYVVARNPHNRCIYARANNQVRWESRKARKNFEKNIAHEAKSNPKAFWAYIKSRLKTRDGTGD